VSVEQKNPRDGEVTSGADRLGDALLRAGLIMITPAIVVFLWLGVIREPLNQGTAKTQLSQAAAETRASLVALYIEDLEQRTTLLSADTTVNSATGEIAPATVGFPEATRIALIPLDDLGTVNLSPGDRGIKSHIDIDIVRQAFAGDAPQPEFVMLDEGSHIVLARGLGKPVYSVLLVEIVTDRLEKLIASGSEGQFRIVQDLSGRETTVAGNLTGTATASAPVAGTPWAVEIYPNAAWINAAKPGWLGLYLPIALAVLGLLLGIIGLRRRINRLLEAEVSKILEAAELRNNLTVSVPALTPLAKMLRQLSLLSRRQLVSQARREATREEVTEPIQVPEMDPPNATSARTQLLGETQDPDSEAATNERAGDGIPDHIFRAASIRGDVHTELTDELVERIGQAIAVLCGEQGIQALVVAHDSRPSSKQIRTTLVKALLASGRDVIDVGEVPTPAFHYATHESDTDSGIMITGGHGSDNVNGFDIVFKRKLAAGIEIEKILETIRSRKTTQGSGRTVRKPIETEYVDRIAVDVALALPLKVVVDNDFGAAARISPQLLEALDCDVVCLNPPEEGPRPKDRTLASSLASLGSRVRTEGADLGILYDANGDRLHTVTERGEPVDTDTLLMLLARDMLERNPGADVVYDIRCSRQFAPFITRAGGRAQMARGGSAFVREKMVAVNAMLAGDFSGHLFISERWYGFNDALYATARLLELLAGASSSYGDIMAALPQSLSTPELSIPVDTRQRRKIMRNLISNAEFPGARVTTLDGLRVDYADGWGVIRSSTSESALSVRFEGNDEASLARVKSVLRRALLTADDGLELPF